VEDAGLKAAIQALSTRLYGTSTRDVLPNTRERMHAAGRIIGSFGL
jgi:hypothetical protein